MLHVLLSSLPGMHVHLCPGSWSTGGTVRNAVLVMQVRRLAAAEAAGSAAVRRQAHPDAGLRQLCPVRGHVRAPSQPSLNARGSVAERCLRWWIGVSCTALRDVPHTALATSLHCTSCRYDDGLQDITNIDFVEAVVRDMMRSNLRLRPRMRWLKMDMTRMDKARDLSTGTGIQRRLDVFFDIVSVRRTGFMMAHEAGGT
jgi:hypothetical protein